MTAVKQSKPVSTAHRDPNTKIVQRYIRIANLDKKNATEDMGL